MHKVTIKEAKARLEVIKMRGYIQHLMQEQKQLELRYNPYHDPQNGRFTTGNGGGGVNGIVLAVAKGQKGSGYYTDTKGDKDWAVLSKKTSSQDQINQFINGNVAPNATNSQNGLTNQAQNGNIKPSIEDAAYGNYKQSIDNMKRSGVKHNQVKDLDHQLTEEEIIDRIGGGDQTKGSCASLAYAYIANKAGYDVLDFRGGESCDEMAAANRLRTAALPNSISSPFRENMTPQKKLKFMKDNIGEGEEFIVSAGKHCSIVKKINGKLYYLELQQEPGVHYSDGSIGVKGWKPMTKASTFKKRFGDSVFHGRYSSISIAKIDDIPKAEGFKELMGYINTPQNEQKKGAKGRAK